VSVDDAVEAGLQVTPSGVVANNPFADKAKKKASGRKASKPKAADSESSGDDDK
jgi:hypothetical protein